MPLFSATTRFIAWYVTVLKVFLRQRPGTTFILVGSSVAVRFANMFAFLLPLKVILLAGSEGVPHLAQSFIEPEQKNIWIIGLSLLAIASYVVGLLIQPLSGQLAKASSRQIVPEANDLALASNQDQKILDFYRQLTELSANLVIILISLTVMSYFVPAVSIALVLAVAAQFCATALVLFGWPGKPLRWIGRFIRGRTAQYLQILSSLNFFFCFLVILYPFVTGGGGNVLGAMLSFALLRQTTRAMAAGVATALRVGRQKEVANVLMFREHRLQPLEKGSIKSLRRTFNRAARTERVVEELGKALGTEGDYEVHWTDAGTNNMSFLEITEVRTDGVRPRHFQQQVLPESAAYALGNEEFLFDQIPRVSLDAPERFTRYRQGGFECQILDYGTGQPVAQSRWRKVHATLLERAWACRPPQSVVDAYQATYPMFADRLTGELVRRLEVAVDTPREGVELRKLSETLGAIRGVLRDMPNYIFNPDLAPSGVVSTATGDHLVMRWSRWRLEPMGSVLPAAMEGQTGAAVLERLRLQRDDIPAEVTVDHLMLVAACFALEGNVVDGKYKAALREVAKLNQIWRRLGTTATQPVEGVAEAEAEDESDWDAETLSNASNDP